MISRISLFSLLALPSLGLAAASSNPADLAREYEQVRKIALRDAKVQAGFEKANERLEEKIVELDPALKNYVGARRRAVAAAPEAPSQPVEKPAPAKVAPAKPVAKAAPAPVAKAAPAAKARTHVVAAGETLGGIAVRYGVSASALKTANKIQDERKLKVGQSLVIPKGGSSAAPKAAGKPAPKPVSAQQKGFWDKLWKDTATH